MLKIADSICLFQYINMDFNLFLVCHFIFFLFIDFYLQCDEISQDIKIKIKTIISNKIFFCKTMNSTENNCRYMYISRILSYLSMRKSNEFHCFDFHLLKPSCKSVTFCLYNIFRTF